MEEMRPEREPLAVDEVCCHRHLERFREVYSISTYLFCVFKYAKYSIRLRPTIPRPDTIGPLPLTPPRNPYEGVPGGANEPRTEQASRDLRCVITKKKIKEFFLKQMK